VTEHGPDCSCTRCRGFEEGNGYRVGEGNQLAVTHGAYSPAVLRAKVDELADEISSIVPASNEADQPTIRLLALALARIEAAHDWLQSQPHGLFRDGKGTPQPILKQLSTWENSAARLCDRLGLTPVSRASLGLDLVRTEAVARGRVDLSRLDAAERAQLAGLLEKAAT
jgi:Phage terminase, small subunit